MRRSSPVWSLGMILVVPFLSGFSLLESKNADVERGNAAFQAGKAEEALGHYDKAIAKLPGNAGVHFDRGAALYALSRFDEAAQEFLRATQAQDPSLKAAAFSNLGNAFFKKDKFKEAIEAYKRALTLNPNDKSAKWNLELAIQKKKQEEEKKKDEKDQQKQDENKDQDQQSKDDQKKDQKQDEKKDEQAQNQKDQKDQQNQKDQDKQQDQQKQPPQQQPAAQKDQKQEDAKAVEAVLDSLERSAKDLERERARLRAVRRAPPARDW